MINALHARFRRPENGWDPVPREHAVKYGAGEWQTVDEALVDEIEQWIGGFQGKRVLDLGGGPGQYSIAIAKRGANVTWHDISRIYRSMAQEKAKEFSVADRVQFSLGYLDEAPALLPDPYDLVFNKGCWNYGFSDASFAGIVFRMVRPGGYGYVDAPNSDWHRGALSGSALLRTWLSDKLAVKIGHPFPPRGRVARLFLRYPLTRLEVDYQSPGNDRIFFKKPGT